MSPAPPSPPAATSQPGGTGTNSIPAAPPGPWPWPLAPGPQIVAQTLGGEGGLEGGAGAAEWVQRIPITLPVTTTSWRLRARNYSSGEGKEIGRAHV